MRSNIQKSLMHLFMFVGTILITTTGTVAQTHSATASTPDSNLMQVASNSNQKATQANNNTKKKPSGKDTGLTAKSSKESATKSKLQDKKTPNKTLKAQTAPVKAGVKTKKSTSTSNKNDVTNSEILTFFLILSIFPLASLSVFIYLVWKEFSPTVYPSGKTYGAHDYLPASKGGAFTFEYNANPMDQWDSSKNDTTKDKIQHAATPVTITREPLNVKSTTKESA